MSHEIIAADADAARAPAQPSSASDSISDLDEPRDALGSDPEDAASSADRRRFADLDLDPEILQGLEDMGYERPMPVQLAVYGPMSAGRDIMVQSRTGSGKTSAFGIPIAQRIDADSAGAQALILAPTRELALQVSREIAQISLHKGLRVQPIYGGAPIKPQIDALAAGAQVISGTPGRVLDHLRRGTLKPHGIRTLVLDECDEMLSMGFQEEIEKIIEHLPAKGERQTVLFSATIPEEIQRIARRHMNEPEEISLSTGNIAVEEISHYYYVVSGVARTRDLLRVLRAEAPDSAIIFCNTREETNTVAKFLQRQGYDAEAISSDLTQRDRERVMKRMRDRNLHFLVATDVAARGIDISDLSHVINYTFPESPEVYVHRTGRTGRAGKSGVAISLVGPRELGSFYYLKLIYKIRPEERDLPSPEEMGVLHEGERYERVAALVHEEPGSEFRALARRVWQSSQGERIVGALVQRLLSQHAVEEAAEATRTEGQPAREQRVRDERPRDERPREARPEDRDERRPGRSEDRRESRHEDRDDRRRDRGERRRDRDEREGRDERRRERWDERGREERGDERRETRRDERVRDERPREERREGRGDERVREDRAAARSDERVRDERPREERREGRSEERREGRGEERREGRGEERREGRSEARGEERREGRSEARGEERGEGRSEARGEERRETRGEERREGRSEARGEGRSETRGEERRETRGEERREGRGEERREGRGDERVREERREGRSEARGEERRETRGEERREERVQDERPREEHVQDERTEEGGEERREARGGEERRDRREERRREKEARREEREARRKERRDERRRRGFAEESDERTATGAREGAEAADADDFVGAFDRDTDRVTVEPARGGRKAASDTKAESGGTWPTYDDLDDEAKEFWETWADEKAERRQQAAPSKPRNGDRTESRTREAAPAASRSRNDDSPAPARTRDEAQARTRDEAPARTRDEAPARTRDTGASRTRDKAPARTRAEAPARTRDEAPARTRDEAPARTRDEAPARTRDEAPTRARDTAPVHTDEDAESGEHGGPGETARLYVNVGKREGLSASDVRRLLGEGVSEDMASRIGSVALRNTHCYVRVPEDIVDAVIAAASGKSYEDRELVIERARR